MVSRRMFLRGSAATLWLPFLPSALPREARGAKLPAAPRRLLYWFIPNGMLADQFTPTTLGPKYALPFPLAPIAPIQSRVSVISGMENRAVNSPGHNACTVALLSDHTLNPALPELDGAVTVDQYAIQQTAPTTPFPSLQLGMDTPFIEATGNDTLYQTTLSWANGQTPLSQLTSAKTVFERMFAGSDPELSEEDIARRQELRKSLLDSLVDRTAALNRTLSVDDKAKLDQFTTGVRELETRIDALAGLECEAPPEPGASLGFAEGVSVMIDLMAVALQCDLTRAITFGTGASTATTVYDFLGISTDHHTLSHNQVLGGVPMTELMTIMNWQVSMWTSLCEKLAAIPEGDGDVLSNTLVNLVSEFGQSNEHTAAPVVVVVAGGEAGGILQGQHRSVGGGGYAPHANLWWTELEFMGADPTGFGTNGTRALDLSVP